MSHIQKSSSTSKIKQVQVNRSEDSPRKRVGSGGNQGLRVPKKSLVNRMINFIKSLFRKSSKQKVDTQPKVKEQENPKDKVQADVLKEPEVDTQPKAKAEAERPSATQDKAILKQQNKTALNFYKISLKSKYPKEFKRFSSEAWFDKALLNAVESKGTFGGIKQFGNKLKRVRILDPEMAGRILGHLK